MKVKIKKLNPEAVIPFKTYGKDFCYDVVAVSCTEVAHNIYKYGLGFALEIQREHWIQSGHMGIWTKREIKEIFNSLNISVDLRPRSSIWKTGMVLSNCEGTIDELYRGEVSAVFYHVMPNLPKYEIGDKIGQIKLGFTLPMEFEVTDELNQTERGTQGYGSTGK